MVIAAAHRVTARRAANASIATYAGAGPIAAATAAGDYAASQGNPAAAGAAARRARPVAASTAATKVRPVLIIVVAHLGKLAAETNTGALLVVFHTNIAMRAFVIVRLVIILIGKRGILLDNVSPAQVWFSLNVRV